MDWRDLVERHPRTTFIGAHVGCYAENLAWVGALLDRCPNFYVDIAARIGELGRQPYSARRFFTQYADRILFGIDAGPDLETYRLYYRFLETDDEYFNYNVERSAGAGPLVCVRLALAAGRVEESLSSKRRAPDLSAREDRPTNHAHQRQFALHIHNDLPFRFETGRIEPIRWRLAVRHSGRARSICWDRSPPDRISPAARKRSPILAQRSVSPPRRRFLRCAARHAHRRCYPQWPRCLRVAVDVGEHRRRADHDRSLHRTAT